MSAESKHRATCTRPCSGGTTNQPLGIYPTAPFGITTAITAGHIISRARLWPCTCPHPPAKYRPPLRNPPPSREAHVAGIDRVQAHVEPAEHALQPGGSLFHVFQGVPVGVRRSIGRPFRAVSRRVVSCRVVSCRVVSCRVVSCRVVSCRVVSFRFVECFFWPVINCIYVKQASRGRKERQGRDGK